MMSRKTQFAWMAAGAAMCLLGIGLALKMRDANKAVGQNDTQVAQNSPPSTMPFKMIITANKEDGNKIEPMASEPPLPVPSPTFPLLEGSAPPLPVPPPPPSPPLLPTPPPEVNVGSAPLPPPLPMDPPLAPVPPVSPPKVSWANPRNLEPVPAPSVILPVGATTTKVESIPGEPPLAAVAGPLQVYEVRTGGETIQEVARRTLGTSERWTEVSKLNPVIKSGTLIAAGTLVRLPAEACVATVDEVEAIKPLPAMRPKSVAAVVKKALPLTGTFPCTIDDKRVLTLPKALRDQLGNCDTILVSPGPDQCLWITNQAHLERLAEHLEQSPAKEMDVRIFKRLYYAQTEKAATSDGTVTISDKLVQFAGLRQDVVLVGIDEHFELWDAAKWRAYTQQKSAEARSAMAERE